MKQEGSKGFFDGLWTLLRWSLVFLAGSAIILVLALGVGNYLARFCNKGAIAGELSSWVQAVGAVFAIVAGFTATAWQMSRQRDDALATEAASGMASLLLAHDALDAVTERLEAALTLGLQRKDLALRGARTGELIAAMREFDMARVPSRMLPDFIRLRSYVAAVNERLTEIYSSEKAPDYTGAIRERSERNGRLESAVKKRNEATTFYANLQSIASQKYNADAFPLTEAIKVAQYNQS